MCALICKPAVKGAHRWANVSVAASRGATTQDSSELKQKLKGGNMGESGECGLQEMGHSGPKWGGALIDLAPSIFDLWTRCFGDKLSPTFVYFLGYLKSVGIAVADEKHDLVRRVTRIGDQN